MKYIFIFLTILIAVTCVAQTSSKTIEEEFDRFDGNKSGWLSGRELTACSCLAYDTNGDNEVTREEYLAGKGGRKNVGSEVSFAAVDGKTYTGTITQIQGDKYKVKYDNVDFEAWLTAPQFQVITPDRLKAIASSEITKGSNASGSYQKGALVEIESKGTWYKGYIVELRPHDFYMVHYDGYADYYNEIVPTNRLRPLAKQTGEPATKLNPAAIANTGSYQDTEGRLYLQSTVRSWGLDLNFIFLGNGGSIIYDPKHGVNPPRFSAELTDNANSIGKYTITNNTLNIVWNNGKRESWNIEQNNGDITYINGGIATRQKPLPAGYRIIGRFAAGAVMPNISGTNTINFNNDGTFAMGTLVNVNTNEDVNSVKSSSKGTYTISGNTLTMNFADGNKEVAVIAEMVLRGQPHYIINGQSYRKEN